MAEKIPAGIDPDHFAVITYYLREILKDAGADQVGMRLNVSPEPGGVKPSDFKFAVVGWVEGGKLKQRRMKKNEANPGLFRFGDLGSSSSSEVYDDALRDPGKIKERDWTTQIHLKKQGARSQAPKAGVLYQRFIAIRIKKEEGNKSRSVGTLTVGFERRPDSTRIGDVDRAMKKWAQNERQSDLIQFLKGQKGEAIGGGKEIKIAGGLEFDGPTF